MYDAILDCLKAISNYPNIFITLVKEYAFEPHLNDYVRTIEFTIIKKDSLFERIIYKASCKDNNPEPYLKLILDDLQKIKDEYMRGKKYESVGY